jgi:hypothetical protein
MAGPPLSLSWTSWKVHCCVSWPTRTCPGCEDRGAETHKDLSVVVVVTFAVVSEPPLSPVDVSITPSELMLDVLASVVRVLILPAASPSSLSIARLLVLGILLGMSLAKNDSAAVDVTSLGKSATEADRTMVKAGRTSATDAGRTIVKAGRIRWLCPEKRLLLRSSCNRFACSKARTP